MSEIRITIGGSGGGFGVQFGPPFGPPFGASAGAQAIVQHDPNFSLDAFVSFAAAVFLRVSQARAAGNLAEVSRLLDAGVAAELRAEGARKDRAGVSLDRSDALSAG